MGPGLALGLRGAFFVVGVFFGFRTGELPAAGFLAGVFFGFRAGEAAAAGFLGGIRKLRSALLRHLTLLSHCLKSSTALRFCLFYGGTVAKTSTGYRVNTSTRALTLCPYMLGTLIKVSKES